MLDLIYSTKYLFLFFVGGFAFLLKGCEYDVCIPSFEIDPLLIGESVQLKLGDTRSFGDCLHTDLEGVVWSVDNTDVVHILPGNMLIGMTPGVFTVTAHYQGSEMSRSGFVLPSGWKPRINASSVTANVGDTVTYDVRAYDSNGNILPPVPYSLNISPSTALKPIVALYSPYQDFIDKTLFRVEMPGKITVSGSIDNKSVASELMASGQVTKTVFKYPLPTKSK